MVRWISHEESGEIPEGIKVVKEQEELSDKAVSAYGKAFGRKRRPT